LCWPRELAPADFHIVSAGKEGTAHGPYAEELAASLEAAGLRVLLDDRPKTSPGVKFKDAELIGIPTIVVVGRGLNNEDEPTIEVKDRKTGEREDISTSAIVDHLIALAK
jgi:prolyl-tRNA synthetase